MNQKNRSLIRIRSYEKSDRDSIIEICYATGYMGEDLTKHFRDRKLFALIFALYYTDYEPKNCFVAVSNGKVVGYIIGTQNSYHQKWKFFIKMGWKILLRFVFYTSWRYPHDLTKIFQIVVSSLKKRDQTSFKVYNLEKKENYEVKQKIDEQMKKNHQIISSLVSFPLPDKEIIHQYPGYLHINLLEEFQSKGVGGQLLTTFENHLVSQGVKGYHLHTTNQNYKAVPFYFKYSLRLLNTDINSITWPKSPPSQRLVFGKKLR
ncbi:MAG: GNAT family N-acetyltransferase [Candidatus Hermodarchaeota archaeon]